MRDTADRIVIREEIAPSSFKRDNLRFKRGGDD